MKFYELITEGKAIPKVVDKFKDVAPSQRSYYIHKWAEEKGIDGDDAMEMAGYERGDYIGAGSYMWNYVGETTEARTESLEALAKHVKEGTALCDSPFRHGSQAYIETFQLAKKLRETGSLPELDWESEEMLSTDVGEKVTLENGETVWLDIPYLIEDEDEEHQFFFVTVGTGRDSIVVKTRAKNRREAIKSQKMEYPDKSVRIKPEENPHLEEADGVNDSGMIGEPDGYYDEEERKEAYNELQDALDYARNSDEHEMVEQGICPNCAGSGYQDGEDQIWDDEEEDYVEGNECDGWGNYGCDEGEMTGAEWVEIVKSDERKAERKQAQDNYPGDEEVVKQIASYMKHMDDPRLAYQQVQADYPHLGRAQRGELIGKASKLAFGEAIDQGSSEGEMIVAKMLAKALGDDNRWTEMSPSELYSELESVNPEAADMIRDVAKMIYDVRLQERVFKDVGVADVVKDARGKEFKFDKDAKQFKSLDGEVADRNTKLGKDLMRLRKNQMKKSTPSYNKSKVMAGKSPHKKGTEKYKKHMAAMHAGESVTNEAEYNGKKVKLNKPMRSSGGGKKYKVYVKNPKTGRVKKISFGDAGLKTKSGNKKRAKSFAARHNCEKKNDKMKAGYWACRLPRYGLVKGGKWW